MCSHFSDETTDLTNLTILPDATPENHSTPPVNHVNNHGVLYHWYTADTTALLTVTAHCHRPPTPPPPLSPFLPHATDSHAQEQLRQMGQRPHSSILPFPLHPTLPPALRLPSPLSSPSERVWTEVRPLAQLNTALTSRLNRLPSALSDGASNQPLRPHRPINGRARARTLDPSKGKRRINKPI